MLKCWICWFSSPIVQCDLAIATRSIAIQSLYTACVVSQKDQECVDKKAVRSSTLYFGHANYVLANRSEIALSTQIHPSY